MLHIYVSLQDQTKDKLNGFFLPAGAHQHLFSLLVRNMIFFTAGAHCVFFPAGVSCRLHIFYFKILP